MLSLTGLSWVDCTVEHLRVLKGLQPPSLQRSSADARTRQYVQWRKPSRWHGASSNCTGVVNTSRDEIRCRGIGFDLGIEPDRGAEENAKKLYTAAYSLLFMHEVLQSKAGQAFLKVLLHLQKGGPEFLLSAYGEWFREVASSGHTSWQDYLLDEIISGRGDPLAKTAARGEAGEEMSMQQAAAYDLDILQRLAVTETTLAGWVSHVASTPEGWLPAAAPAGGIGGRKPLSREEVPRTADLGGRAWIRAPLAPGQRKAWRNRIGGCWKWSEALPDLLALWEAHGIGLVAKHSVLHFQDGAFIAPSTAAMPLFGRTIGNVPKGAGGKVEEAVPEAPFRSVEEGIQSLLADTAAILHSGDYDAATQDEESRWWNHTEAAMAKGVRIVLVPESTLAGKGMDALGRALGQHPRVLFYAIAFPSDSLQSEHGPHSIEAQRMAKGGWYSWPPNAALFHLAPGMQSLDEV